MDKLENHCLTRFVVVVGGFRRDLWQKMLRFAIVHTKLTRFGHFRHQATVNRQAIDVNAMML